MTNDSLQSADKVPQNGWALPPIIDMEMRIIDYQAPSLRNFESMFSEYNEAIEFIVTTEAPVPIRALSPVLLVGTEQVAEIEQLSQNTYRFLAFEPERFEPGVTIRWGWIGDSEDELSETGYQFEL